MDGNHNGQEQQDNVQRDADGVEIAHLGGDKGDSKPSQQRESEQPAQQSQEHESSDADNTQRSDDQETPFEELPTYWQQEIQRLRKENADRRATNRDMSSTTRTQEERIAALEQELADRQAAEAAAMADMQKTKILADRNLPTDLSHMLTGDTAEDWEADADSLVELRGNKGPTPDPVQVAVSKQSNEKTDKERAAEAFFAGLNK